MGLGQSVKSADFISQTTKIFMSLGDPFKTSGDVHIIAALVAAKALCSHDIYSHAALNYCSFTIYNNLTFRFLSSTGLIFCRILVIKSSKVYAIFYVNQITLIEYY